MWNNCREESRKRHVGRGSLAEGKIERLKKAKVEHCRSKEGCQHYIRLQTHPPPLSH